MPESTPETPAAIPAPVTVPRPHGTRPGAKLAAFTKLLAVMAGPSGVDVRLTVAVNPPPVAVITIAPGTEPAVTVVTAWPFAPVVTLPGFKPATPVTTL